MYIITDKKAVVIGSTNKLVYADNGNVGVNETYFFDKSIVGEVLEVETLPVDYVDGKYKYVEGQFSVVEGWTAPQDAPSIELNALKATVETQEQAIVELSMLVASLMQ